MTNSWKPHPLIYEINTWPWLNYLSKQYQQDFNLNSIPEQIFQEEFKYYDAIWLMGVWSRSQQGKLIARSHEGLKKEYKRVLPNYTEKDIVGSPYAIKDYIVDPILGGNDGLRNFYNKLKEYDKKLVLDFVPNHVAMDHSWRDSHPEYLLQGTENDLVRDNHTFFKYKNLIFAHGKDPYFDAWTDTIQINCFSKDLRTEITQILKNISEFCDGVRCDMAMLMESTVFKQTWRELAYPEPQYQFWEEIIPAVKKINPNFIFIGEVYWDLEWTLQQQGFDYCYDKRLFDRIKIRDYLEIRNHLNATWDYQSKLIRFLENHDESRFRENFPIIEQIPYISMLFSLPGAHLLHFGQEKGFSKKIPVQLGIYPNETLDSELVSCYNKLFSFLGSSFGREGKWILLGKDSKTQNQNIGYIGQAWCIGKELILILSNLSSKTLIIDLSTSEFNQFYAKMPIFRKDSEISSNEYQMPNLLEPKRRYSIELKEFGCHLVRYFQEE